MLHTHFFSNFSMDIKKKRWAIQESNLLLLDFYCLLKIMCLLYFAIIKASF